MSKHRPWLFAEIERWKKEGLIEAQQAAALRALYPEEDASPWGLIVFCSLGAIVVGLGIVLLIAYNWAEIPRLGKLSLILTGLGAAHGFGLWLVGRSDWRVRIGEALLLLGTMLFGAGIWLVAQTYHIDEHYPNGFLIWGLGALALAWAARSIAQLIVAAVLIAIWSGAETLAFDQAPVAALGLLMLGILPLAWLVRSALALAATLSAITFVLLMNAGFWGGSGATFTASLSLSILFIGAAHWPYLCREFPSGARVASFFGLSGFLICSYLLSFNEIARSLLRWGFHEDTTSLLVYGWGIFVLAAATWLTLGLSTFRMRKSRVSIELWLCPIALIYAQILVVQGYYQEPHFIAGVFNCIFLGVTLMWMVRGCRDGVLYQAVLGCVLFAAWIFARYFDLFDSLAARGLAFLLLGGALFCEGFFYRKRKQDSARKVAP